MHRTYKDITEGYNDFIKQYRDSSNSIMTELAGGQKPDIMMISCCDSRVDPAIVLKSEPGDMFVVRSIANLVPSYEHKGFLGSTSAALEYGICYLGVKNLVICGHSSCGGIAALLNRDSIAGQDDFIGKYLDIISQNKNFASSLEKSGNDTDSMAKQSLHLSYENCLSFPWIKERLDNNKLAVHRWFFNIQESQLEVYNQDNQKFEVL